MGPHKAIAPGPGDGRPRWEDHSILLGVGLFLRPCAILPACGSHSPSSPPIEVQDDLQAKLTDPIIRRQLHHLINHADIRDRLRLNSLTTPHATTWTTTPSPTTTLFPLEFRCGLLWILGLPFRPADYKCPTCGAHADMQGIHAVSCVRSGDITRGHNRLRDLLFFLLEDAGKNCTVEVSLPQAPELRPADVLVASWKGRPLAIDVTVVTPTCPSAIALSPPEGPTALLDHAAARKVTKYSVPCRAAGWDFRPFAADAYGATRADARELVRDIIKLSTARGKIYPDSLSGNQVWGAISAAAVSRAAIALAALRNVGSPLGIDLNGLQLMTARGALSTHSLGTPRQTADAVVDMGTGAIPQPSLPLHSSVL